MATEYQDNTGTILWEPYRSRKCALWLRNSTERSARPVRIASDGTNRSNAITSFSMRRWGSSSPSTVGSAPASGPTSAAILIRWHSLVRGYGLDTCPQVIWIRIYKIVGAVLPTPARADAVLRDGDWLRRPQPRRQSLPLVAGGAARILHVLWIRLTCSVLLRKLGTRGMACPSSVPLCSRADRRGRRQTGLDTQAWLCARACPTMG